MLSVLNSKLVAKSVAGEDDERRLWREPRVNFVTDKRTLEVGDPTLSTHPLRLLLLAAPAQGRFRSLILLLMTKVPRGLRRMQRPHGTNIVIAQEAQAVSPMTTLIGAGRPISLENRRLGEPQDGQMTTAMPEEQHSLIVLTEAMVILRHV